MSHIIDRLIADRVQEAQSLRNAYTDNPYVECAIADRLACLGEDIKILEHIRDDSLANYTPHIGHALINHLVEVGYAKEAAEVMDSVVIEISEQAEEVHEIGLSNLSTDTPLPTLSTPLKGVTQDDLIIKGENK